MDTSFSEFITGIFELLFFIAPPLTIQLILYPIAKLCFKKIPSHKIYTACLVVNTILLLILKQWYLSSQDPSEMEPLDAFDGIIITIIWAPFYIGVLMWCIIENVKAKKADQKDEIDQNEADSESNSDLCE